MQRAASALLFSGKDNEGHEAMDADGLQRGFQLGEWRVTPADSTIAGPSGTRTLQPANLQLLLALAAHRGEAIDKVELISPATAPEPAGIPTERKFPELVARVGASPHVSEAQKTR